VWLDKGETVNAFWPNNTDHTTAFNEAQRLANRLGCTYWVARFGEKWAIVPNQLQAFGEQELVSPES
jgi:hypothetical protein